MALIFVVIIETFILSKIFNTSFKILWIEVLNMNIFSTLGGFLAQGFIRLILGITFFTQFDNYSKFPVLAIIFSNVGYPVNTKITAEIIFDLVLSLIITFLISIFMEYHAFKRNIIFDKFKKKELLLGVFTANLISYTLLSIWVFFKLSHLQ